MATVTSVPVLGGYRAHADLWALFDGTPAFAPPGRLFYDRDGRVSCHLCGRAFDQLGPHLRSHGWTAARYRDAVGLGARDPLGRDRPRHLSRREIERRQRDSRLRARPVEDEPAAG